MNSMVARCDKGMYNFGLIQLLDLGYSAVEEMYDNLDGSLKAMDQIVS